jgi:methylated-DNA-[protein]-cysteine S-methyltransferase
MDLTTLPTPVGPLVIVADDGVVLAAGWSEDPNDVLDRIHPSLRTATNPRGFVGAEVTRRSDLGDVTKAVVAYFDGDLAAPDAIPVRQVGGPFLVHAWDVLRDVRPGEPVSYTELAARCGNPRAVRAAASACARNAAALFVPCHRVLRSDGSLGGFRWGLDVKRWLLAHERAARAAD